MEDFMSDLLARAAGKKTVDQLYPAVGDHVSSMIADETIRREHSSQYDEDEFSDSSTTYAEDNTDETECSIDYPSYESLFGSSGYSSSPTYIRSDFYSLTPPTSPSLSTSSEDDNMKTARRLSFSIDSIFDNDVDSTSDTCDSFDVPAQVFSSYTSLDSYITGDQQTASLPCIDSARHQNSTQCDNEGTQYLYWCHVCEDVCCDHVDVCMHRNIHYSNRDPCRLQKSIFKQTGYVTRHEIIPCYMEKVKCGLCEKIVPYRLLKVHLQCHEGHVCEICDHEFPSLCHLRDHFNSQHGNLTHICHVCKEQFSDRRELSVHSRQHKLCLYQCNICFWSFRTRHAQRVHYRTHTGSKPHAYCSRMLQVIFSVVVSTASFEHS